MEIQEIFNLIKDVKPGIWKIGLTYKKDLPLLKNAGAAGYNTGDVYKIVFRWCSANVNKKNTKAYKDAREKSQQKAADQNKVWQPRPTGFHKSDVADELNIIEYNDKDNKPCLVLKKGPNPDKITYYIKGQEASLDEIEKLIEQKVISSSVLKEFGPNGVFYIYPEKVQSLKIDGILHENLGDDNMAKFNGITLPNEDGLGLDEEIKTDSINTELIDNEELDESFNKNSRKFLKEDYEARRWGYRNYKEYKYANNIKD